MDTYHCNLLSPSAITYNFSISTKNSKKNPLYVCTCSTFPIFCILLNFVNLYFQFLICIFWLIFSLFLKLQNSYRVVSWISQWKARVVDTLSHSDLFQWIGWNACFENREWKYYNCLLFTYVFTNEDCFKKRFKTSI